MEHLVPLAVSLHYSSKPARALRALAVYYGYMSTILGVITVLIALISYSIYIRDMLRGRTKPHSVTWLVWALLNSFIFYEQLVGGAGPGAWVTGSAALANVIILLLSIRYGERRVSRLDWVCLIAALGVFVFWQQTANGTVAVVLACLIFILGFIPTIRKAWRHAREETALTFALNSSKFLIALFALEAVTVTTALYPAVLFAMNAGFVVLLLVRRRIMKVDKKRRAR